MKADIFIKNNTTGEVVNYKDDIDDEGNMFIWEEGNFSCDCNRFLFFERAKGNKPDWDDGKCGNGGFSVNIKVGEEYYLKEFDSQSST